MLLTREEMHFDFGGAKLDPVKDKEVLGWMMQQFLYGEVTGIQVGHWIYHAPDFKAARFLSKQALEEFQHVGNFLKILDILEVDPAPAHPVIRFLATGMMGGEWAEHVALEMAMGEGLVLQAFYAMVQLIDHPDIVAILKRGVRQEESHVRFGEERTMEAIAQNPKLKQRLLGLCLVSLFGVRQLGSYMKKNLPMDHPALSQLPAFLDFTHSRAELRLRRMGLLDRPLAELGSLRQARLVAQAYAEKAAGGAKDRALSPLKQLGLVAKEQKLTDTYLADAEVQQRGFEPNRPVAKAAE